MPAGNYVMEIADHPLSGSYWHLRRCNGCGVVYVDPRPEQQIFAGFVADEQRDIAGKRTWIRRLQTVERFRSPRRLLDVGSGAGAFLSYARARGWSPLGLDVQPSFARSVSQRLGIEVHVGEITDALIQAQQFDAVCMWDVIEHVPSIRPTLAAAGNIVAPGGVLAISTINADSTNARVFGSRWIFWNRPGKVPEHLQAFMPRTLQEVMRVTVSCRYRRALASRPERLSNP
jgi:2-polyprenyl-3-methyl-5-hydroxy-6-metoxy-1,4-benzoquinol methylase